VVGAAPPNKAGSAAAMSETVQELGLAVGVAVLGSVAAAVYRERIAAAVPTELLERVREGLPAASEAQLPAAVQTAAKEAFTAGLGVAAALAGSAVLVLAVLAATVLRRVPTTGAEDDMEPLRGAAA
jgi:DHA2 family multidrug resistance protein-like MFS transporter